MENPLVKFLSEYLTLTEEEKDAIEGCNFMESFNKGDILLKAGERSNKSYFVLKGCIRSYYLMDGEEKTTAFYVENEPIMPICAITHAASEYYLACVEDSLVSTSTTDMEEPFFEKFPRFESICRMMSERMLARTQMSYERYRTSSPEQRYVFLMDERPDLLNRIPQYLLASFLGIKPESLSRIRRRLAKK